MAQTLQREKLQVVMNQNKGRWLLSSELISLTNNTSNRLIKLSNPFQLGAFLRSVKNVEKKDENNSILYRMK